MRGCNPPVLTRHTDTQGNMTWLTQLSDVPEPSLDSLGCTDMVSFLGLRIFEAHVGAMRINSQAIAWVL